MVINHHQHLVPFFENRVAAKVITFPDRITAALTQMGVKSRTRKGIPNTLQPGSGFSSIRENSLRRSLSSVIISPNDIPSAISLDRISVWYRPTSTLISCAESQASSLCQSLTNCVCSLRENCRLAEKTWIASDNAGSNQPGTGDILRIPEFLPSISFD